MLLFNNITVFLKKRNVKEDLQIIILWIKWTKRAPYFSLLKEFAYVTQLLSNHREHYKVSWTRLPLSDEWELYPTNGTCDILYSEYSQHCVCTSVASLSHCSYAARWTLLQLPTTVTCSIHILFFPKLNHILSHVRCIPVSSHSPKKICTFTDLGRYPSHSILLPFYRVFPRSISLPHRSNWNLKYWEGKINI